MANRVPADGHAAVPPPFVLRVFRVEPDTEQYLRTLSPVVSGLWTHYVRRRSEFCPPEVSRCLNHKLPRFWKGYIAAELYHQADNVWLACVLEITPHLELDFRHVYERGQVWKLTRPPVTRESKPPVKGVLLERRDPKTFPPAFDVLPTLMQLYHVEQISLGIANPLPDRQWMEPTKDAPPAELVKPQETPPTAEQYAELRRRRLISDETARAGKRVNGNGHV